MPTLHSTAVSGNPSPADLACAVCNLSFAANGGIESLATDLLALSADVDDHDPLGLLDDPSDPDCQPTIDCRLNYQPTPNLPMSTWYFLTGLSDYDQDHRGHWGASSVGANLTEEAARAIAADLLNQVLDSVAQSA